LFGFYRFLQGPETDPATVRKIREAIDNQTEVTVQLINYTKSGVFTFCNLYTPYTILKGNSVLNNYYPLLNILNSGKKFWNLFHLQPMRDQKVHTTSNNRSQDII
jgi:hypothetical protein